MDRLMKLVTLLLLCGVICVSTKSLAHLSGDTTQLLSSSLLTWENFNNDSNLLKYAVVGGVFTGEDNQKAYVCRATINSVPVSGYIKKRVSGDREDYVCIISQHSQFRTKGQFEILLNKGDGVKLQWVKWEKLVPFDSITGAVSTGNGGSKNGNYFVARHKKNNSMEHHEIDHAIGFFDSSDGLGKIYATVASAEHSFVEGEILTATEPIRYELFDIKFTISKLRQKVNRTLLGQTVLKNEGDVDIDVNAVIGYEYDVERNFGNHDGIARSINTTAFVSNNERVDFFWGIQENHHAVSSKGVGTRLAPGTALNVTLWGNYTTNEGPYRANLVTYWADGTKSKKKLMQISSGLEANLEDQLQIENSPTYWLLNNTIVPTTTQKTFTDVSTQNVHKSIFSTSMSSNAIEKITEKYKHRNDDEDVDDDSEDDDAKTSTASTLSFTCLLVLSLLKFSF